MKPISLDEALKIITNNPGESKLRTSSAVQGMLSEASDFKSDNEYYVDTLALLDKLSLAKVKIDKTSCHDIEIVKVTADILYSAQLYVDEETIPCTEWPTPKEVVDHLIKENISRGQIEPPPV